MKTFIRYKFIPKQLFFYNNCSSYYSCFLLELKDRKPTYQRLRQANVLAIMVLAFVLVFRLRLLVVDTDGHGTGYTTHQLDLQEI